MTEHDKATLAEALTWLASNRQRARKRVWVVHLLRLPDLLSDEVKLDRLLRDRSARAAEGVEILTLMSLLREARPQSQWLAVLGSVMREQVKARPMGLVALVAGIKVILREQTKKGTSRRMLPSDKRNDLKSALRKASDQLLCAMSRGELVGYGNWRDENGKTAQARIPVDNLGCPMFADAKTDCIGPDYEAWAEGKCLEGLPTYMDVTFLWADLNATFGAKKAPAAERPVERAISRPRLSREQAECFLRELEAERGTPPAKRLAETQARDKFKGYNVTRGCIEAAHKKLYRNLLPGRRTSRS